MRGSDAMEEGSYGAPPPPADVCRLALPPAPPPAAALLRRPLRHFLVEYPGYVGSEERVLETLGDLDGIAHQLQDNAATLPLKLRPSDPYCHAIYASRHRTKCLLLKLSRPRRPGTRGAGAGQPADMRGSSSPPTEAAPPPPRRQQQQSGDAAAKDGQGQSAMREAQPQPGGAGCPSSPGAGVRDAGGGNSYRATVVAAVETSYRFRTPADYQYLLLPQQHAAMAAANAHQGLLTADPAAAAALATGAAGARDPPGLPPQPLMAVPPIFAKTPVFDYAFRQFHGTEAAIQAAAATPHSAAAPRHGRGAVTYVAYLGEEAPSPPPDRTVGSTQLADCLRRLLARRAVWTAAAVREAVEEAMGGPVQKSALNDLLPRLAYKFRTGPWKQAWVARGYDPRMSQDARRWQVYEYHLPGDWYSKIAEHKAAAAAAAAAAEARGGTGAGAPPPPALRLPLAGAYRQLARFEAAPSTQNCLLQLCDLHDSAVAATLEDPANHTETCSTGSGWLTTAGLDAIRKRVKDRFKAVLEGEPMQDSYVPPAAAAGRGLEGELGAAAAPMDAKPPPPPQQQQQQQAREQGGAQAMEAEASGSTGAPPAWPGQEAPAAMQQQQQEQRGTPEVERGRQGAAAFLPSQLFSSLESLFAQMPAQEEFAVFGEEEDEDEEGGGGGAGASEGEEGSGASEGEEGGGYTTDEGQTSEEEGGED